MLGKSYEKNPGTYLRSAVLKGRISSQEYIKDVLTFNWFTHLLVLQTCCFRDCGIT